MKERFSLIKVTYKCNNNCIFCHEAKDLTDPSIFEIKQLIERAAKLKSGVVFFSGGESTIRDDIFEIISYATAKGLIPGIITNGRMFAYQGFTRRMVEKGLSKVNVSVLSSNPGVYTRLTQNPSSFRETLGGLKNLVSFLDKGDITLRVIINKLNINNLNRTIDFFSKIGLRKFVLVNTQPCGNALINARELIVPFDEFKERIDETLSFGKENGLELFLDEIPLCLVRKEFRCRVLQKELILSPPYKPSSFVKLDKCSSCVLNEKCSGFDSEYANVYKKIVAYPVFSGRSQ